MTSRGRLGVLTATAALAAGVFMLMTEREAPPDSDGPTEPINFVRGPSASPSLPAVDTRPRPAPVPGLASTTSVTNETMVIDPILGDFLPNRAEDPRTLYKLVRSQPKDSAWAREAEARLRAEYAAVPHVGAAENPLRIICAATVCEVAGSMPDRLSMQETDVAMQALQNPTLAKSLATHGLKWEAAMFGPGASGQSTFVTYLSRK